MYEQITIFDLFNDLENLKKSQESFYEKINKLELIMIELSKKQQGYDLPDPKVYLIFRIINKKIEYFLELGYGYTNSIDEAGKFNETGINHFNAYIVNSFDEAFNNNYDYYAINILKSN